MDDKLIKILAQAVLGACVSMLFIMGMTAFGANGETNLLFALITEPEGHMLKVAAIGAAAGAAAALARGA